ncbi:ZIP family metal transporter [Halorubrum sp. DTA98]|uniref:ZIP family metal transporter n=1 Tax=Halorubrum sp. DTA98 TaxID=3402163 RepID=UPI003AAF2B67
MTDIVTVLAITGAAGLATGIGALPVFVRARVSHRTYDAALGLAAGIMVAASVFGLILPGMEDGGLATVMIGLVIGGFALLAGNRAIPHVHAAYREWTAEGGATEADVTAVSERAMPFDPDGPTDPVESDTPRGSTDPIASPESATDPASPSSSEQDGVDARIRKALLVGGAITLHNAPEGLAMGVAFASGLEEVAVLLAIVIGLQNVPDGFAFAVPMGETGMNRGRVLLYTTLSGFVPQIVAATFGYYLVSFAAGLFPVAAGFAAGAMLAVVFREMIPSSHGHGYADAATTAFLLGFVVLVVVDEVLVL